MTFDLERHTYQRDNEWFETVFIQPRNYSAIIGFQNFPIINLGNFQILDYSMENHLQDYRDMIELTLSLIQGTKQEKAVPLWLVAHAQMLQEFLNLDGEE